MLRGQRKDQVYPMSVESLVPAADDSFAQACLHISVAGGDFLRVTHRPPVDSAALAGGCGFLLLTAS